MFGGLKIGMVYKNIIRHAAVAFLLIGCMAFFPVSSRATLISVDFGSLPSAQGWSFETNTGSAETAFFSVDGGVMHQDTIGIGASYAGYRLSDLAFDPSLPFTITVNARVLSEQKLKPLNTFGFSFGLFTGTEQFSVGLGAGGLQTRLDYQHRVVPFDTTQFHEYILSGKPGEGFQLYIDSVLFYSGATASVLYPTSLFFGDNTIEDNALAEIRQFVFRQESAPAPEPATILLSGIGIVGLAGLRKKSYNRII